MRVSSRSGFIALALLLLMGLLWHSWVTRFVEPHTKLIFTAPRNCTIYMPSAVPEDFSFIGGNLDHSIRDHAQVHEIVISGMGSIKYRRVDIIVNSKEIRINGQILSGNWCSYVVTGPDRISLGEIRTVD